MKIVKCDYCGKEIKIPPSREKFKHHFCCKEHHNLFMEEKYLMKCDYCGKSFLRCYGEIKKAEKHYCSNECRYKASRGKNDYIEHKDYIEVKCKNYSVLLDKEDFKKIESKIMTRKKENDNTPYAYVLNKPLHRVIMNCPKNMVIDHINHNGLDNRKQNLRICTVRDNCRNRVLSNRNTSGHLGVSWSQRMEKWKVTIQVGNKSLHGGYFEKIEDAVKSRKDLEKKYWSADEAIEYVRGFIDG